MKFPIEIPFEPKEGEEKSSSVFVIRNPLHLVQVVRHMHKCLDTLEEIAMFDPTESGDKAMETLKQIGVWSPTVTRVEDCG